MFVTFEELTLERWRQFEDVRLQFHTNMTILTGANGSGKTTILNLLNRHFGWNIELVSTPERDESKGILKYLAGIWHYRTDKQRQDSSQQNCIGNIRYSDKHIAKLIVPETVQKVYNIKIQDQLGVNGLHIPSHRPALTYQDVSQIPIAPQTRGQVIHRYFSEVMSHYKGSGGRSPNYSLKETLISLAMFGYGNAAVRPNQTLIDTFEGFQDVLRTMLPPEIGFEGIRINVPEVILMTRTGNFSFDAISGGIAALIDMAWQIYMYAFDNDNLVVTIDEPENHLHPRMQRTVLPNLIHAFHNVQFIVATHNPFIVSSVSDANVYVLAFTHNNKVTSEKLDWQNRAGSANEILRDVLGVPFTYPQWVEDRLNAIISKYADTPLSSSLLKDLRREMTELGFEHLFPASLEKILDREM